MCRGMVSSVSVRGMVSSVCGELVSSVSLGMLNGVCGDGE